MAADTTVVYQTDPAQVTTTSSSTTAVPRDMSTPATVIPSSEPRPSDIGAATRTTTTTTGPVTATTVSPGTSGSTVVTTPSTSTTTTTVSDGRMDPVAALDALKRRASMTNQNLNMGSGDGNGRSSVVRQNLERAEYLIRNGKPEEARGYLKVAAGQLGVPEVQNAL